MTRCGFGYPVKPGSKTVFFCDDEATCAFNQPVAGVPGYVVRVRVCDEHAEWLRFAYLLQNAVSQSPRVLPCICGEPDAPGVNHRMTGPCHVDLGVETHEDVIKHEHTEAECGHDLYLLDSHDNVKMCRYCDEHHGPYPWCAERCDVFRTELIESVKLAERAGDIPVSADETYEDWEGNTP